MSSAAISRQRLHLKVQGAVQGVGFRPFVYRLATELGLKGWVNNSAQGVLIEVEGTPEQIARFQQHLEQDKPPLAWIQRVEVSRIAPLSETTFEIHASQAGEKTALVLPDVATCEDCLKEIFDSSNRRYRYPFTNCTNCGPRFSIINALPYDRPNTAMGQFHLCAACEVEYRNPLNRRFHAQPNACPDCGPRLDLWDKQGNCLDREVGAHGNREIKGQLSHSNPLSMAAEAIRQGKIVAVKGLGGFHLMVDARNQAAVTTLRQRKRRPAKPLALMYPSLVQVQADCQVSEVEAQWLRSPQAPIVLLKRLAPIAPTNGSQIAAAVAPDNPYLGVMLPYTPLHHLLMAELGFPVVATSGNLTDEPICINEQEAVQRLQGIADLFLVHNRPIVRPVDDSILRVIEEKPVLLRRARGYAPLPVPMNQSSHLSLEHVSVLGVGAHLKNTIALSVNDQIFVSQHIGDLDKPQTLTRWQQTIRDLQTLYERKPTAIACDLHPDYRSTQWARQLAQALNIPLIPVQHHYAHVLAGLIDNRLTAPALGIAWDGTGYGVDGTIWGGEFLRITDTGFVRAAYLRPFRLPGGEQAVKAPWRSALGLLDDYCGDRAFEMVHLSPLQQCSEPNLQVLKTMLHQHLNSPLTSSMGRFFDAIASLIGLQQTVEFEGQAAMALEFALERVTTDEQYGFEVRSQSSRDPSSPLIVDWGALLQGVLADLQREVAIAKISAKFHNTLVEMLVSVAKQIGEPIIVLTGGCFQNQYLITRAIQRLREEGFQPYWHHQLPPNDGGIAVGQVVAALRGTNELCA